MALTHRIATMRCIVAAGAALALVTLPSTALAEVMDKEASLGEIWAWAAISSVLVVGAWRIRWWLGPTLTAVLSVYGVAISLELADVSVGPAILLEAGTTYPWHFGAASLLFLSSNILGFLLWRSSRRRPQAMGSAL
ncbi:MAG TPA: hypothetical protein P5147_22145 [Myxococcota bacterium]|nr:hypothetical protein [Myxococcota bacterium]